MRQPIRLGMMVVAAALVFSACSSATTTPTPAPTATPAPPASATAAANTSAPTATPTPVIYTGPKVTITWFCCLGTGEDASQQAVEKQVVADFNAAHPNINLVFELNPYTGARDKLSTELASGNGPDVVGPVGVGGSEAFHGQWADLAPWITKYNYDLSEFDQSAIDFYKQIYRKVIESQKDLQYQFETLEHEIRHVIVDEQEHVVELSLLLGI